MSDQLPPSEFRTPFVINKTPFCFWDVNIPETNLRFINQIDPNYFDYVSNVNFNILKNKDEEIDEKTRQYAAVTMRIAYSLGLEVLFSFLFASVQAPHCVIGWLSKYSNAELFDVVKRFRNYEEIFHDFPDMNIRGWESLVNLIFIGLNDEQKEKASTILEGFSRLWGQYAQDFLDTNFNNEYNSIKHGLRIHMGGYHLMMGPPQKEIGEITPLEKMETVAFSKFGTTFFVPERIEKTPNYVVHTQSRNWNPEDLYHGLQLISVSLKNILVFLKQVNGVEETMEYILPNDEEFYRKPWLLGSGSSMGHKSRINVTKIPLLSKEDILAIYKKPEPTSP